MNIIKKIVIVIIMLISFLAIYKTNVYSFGVNDINGKSTSADSSINEMNKSFQSVVKVLTTAGSIISVVVLVAIGIKYMLGSVEEKATYKKTLMPYVIGCFILFSASTIAGIIYKIITTA